MRQSIIAMADPVFATLAGVATHAAAVVLLPNIG